MSSGSSASLSDQIQHHLSNWDTHVSLFGIRTTLHLDTICMSVFLLTILALVFYCFSQNLKLSPSKSQNFFESIVDAVYKEVATSSPQYVHIIGPLGLTVFIAILFMNMMDFLPTSIGGEIMLALGLADNFKIVPTADLNTTLAFSTLCLLVIQTSVVKKHGLGHYIMGWLSQPLGLAAFPLNILLRIIEEFSRVLSLAMRLYGNMFAGEIIFALLALSPAYIHGPGVIGWCFFHILIVYLQAFIFMMLTVIGFGLALDH